jgi:hypothetical protein
VAGQNQLTGADPVFTILESARFYLAKVARCRRSARGTCAGSKRRVQGGRTPPCAFSSLHFAKATVLGRQRPVKRARAISRHLNAKSYQWGTRYCGSLFTITVLLRRTFGPSTGTNPALRAFSIMLSNALVETWNGGSTTSTCPFVLTIDASSSKNRS